MKLRYSHLIFAFILVSFIIYVIYKFYDVSLDKNSVNLNEDCLNKFKLEIYHLNKANKNDTLFRYINIVNVNAKKDISISQNLSSLNKNYFFGLDNIYLGFNDGNYIGKIEFNVYKNEDYYWIFIIYFDDSVKIHCTDAAQRYYFDKQYITGKSDYDKMVNECLKQTNYCILQIQVDWKKQMNKLKELKDKSSYLYQKKIFDKFVKEQMNKK